MSQQRTSQIAREGGLPPTRDDAAKHGELRREMLATQLERERLDLAIAKAELIDVSAMDTALSKAFTMVERRLRAFPGRLAPAVDPAYRPAVVAAARAAVEELITVLRGAEGKAGA